MALLRNSDHNTPNLDLIGRRMGAFAAGKSYPAVVPVAVSAADLKAYEGVYSQGAVTRTLRVTDGKLVSQRSGGSTVVLTPLGQDRFVVGNDLAQIQFQRNAAGQVMGQVFYPDGDDQGPAQPLPRTGDVPQRPDMALDATQRQALVGQFVGDRLSISVFVDPQGVLRGQVAGQPAVTLKASAPREFTGWRWTPRRASVLRKARCKPRAEAGRRAIRVEAPALSRPAYRSTRRGSSSSNSWHRARRHQAPDRASARDSAAAVTAPSRTASLLSVSAVLCPERVDVSHCRKRLHCQEAAAGALAKAHHPSGAQRLPQVGPGLQQPFAVTPLSRRLWITCA